MITLSGLSIPSAFSLLMSPAYTKRITLSQQIANEKNIILKCKENKINCKPTNEKTAKDILEQRINIIDIKDAIDIKTFKVKEQIKFLENNIKRAHLVYLKDNLTDQRSLDQIFTLYYQDYNADELLEMVNNSIPFYKDATKEIFWEQRFDIK